MLEHSASKPMPDLLTLLQDALAGGYRRSVALKVLGPELAAVLRWAARLPDPP